MGSEQYLTTVCTALEISGGVDVDNYITLPTNSRNGRFPVISSSSYSSNFIPAPTKRNIAFAIQSLAFGHDTESKFPYFNLVENMRQRSKISLSQSLGAKVLAAQNRKKEPSAQFKTKDQEAGLW